MCFKFWYTQVFNIITRDQSEKLIKLNVVLHRDLQMNQEHKTNLQEWLDFAPELDLPLGHSLGDLPGVPVDARDEGMTEGLVRRSVVVRLHDHGLATGVSAREDQDDFASFHNLAHFGNVSLKFRIYCKNSLF